MKALKSSDQYRRSPAWSREYRRARRGGQSGFTMVEISICLAVIAFALVAIIGVLPLGMGVQKENREQTVVGQDANYFMDAIRSGARGLDDLTNYVYAITNYTHAYTVTSAKTNINPGSAYQYGFGAQQFPINPGQSIVGMLSAPRYAPVFNAGGLVVSNQFTSNYVVAFVRALSGSASEKYPQQDTNVQALAFGYRMVPDILPVSAFNNGSSYCSNLETNLYDVRLTFYWPQIPGVTNVSSGHMVCRTLVGGDLVPVLPGVSNAVTLYYFQPQTFVKAQ